MAALSKFVTEATNKAILFNFAENGCVAEKLLCAVLLSKQRLAFSYESV
jgi:hypothetical protein